MMDPRIISAASRATCYHRASRAAPWEPYTDPQSASILHALKAQPFGGRMPLALGTTPFEIRWGSQAFSEKWGRQPASRYGPGMLQVNMRNGNTREVKIEPEVQPAAQSESGIERGAPTAGTCFAHQMNASAPWEPYSMELNGVIAQAKAERPDGGSVDLPGIPFKVCWGNEAPGFAFGMKQVNVRSGKTRAVKQLNAPPPAPMPPQGRTPAPMPHAGLPRPTPQPMPPAMPPTNPPAPQKMTVRVPPGMRGGQMVQVQTPAGLMNVPIPMGVAAGAAFEFLLPSLPPPGPPPGRHITAPAPPPSQMPSAPPSALQPAMAGATAPPPASAPVSHVDGLADLLGDCIIDAPIVADKLQLASSFCRANGACSIADLIKYKLADEFVDALEPLRRIPKARLKERLMPPTSSPPPAAASRRRRFSAAVVAAGSAPVRRQRRPASLNKQIGEGVRVGSDTYTLEELLAKGNAEIWAVRDKMDGRRVLKISEDDAILEEISARKSLGWDSHGRSALRAFDFEGPWCARRARRRDAS